MLKKWSKLRIGPRTLKTALAVTLSIIMVSFYGSSTSNLIFATIGALSAMGATFKESLQSCFSQAVPSPALLSAATLSVSVLHLELPAVFVSYLPLLTPYSYSHCIESVVPLVGKLIQWVVHWFQFSFYLSWCNRTHHAEIPEFIARMVFQVRV